MENDDVKRHTRMLSESAPGAEETRRLHAIRELGAARAGEAIDALMAQLRDPSKAVQEAARDALITIGGEYVVKAATPLLDEENATVRNLAIEVLGKVGSAAPQHLYQTIRNGSDDAKIFALDILGVLEYAPAIDDMASALASANVNVRNACVMAMSRIASPKAIPYFLKALEDDEWVRFSAIEGLCRTGAPEVVDALVDKMRASRTADYYSGILECFIQMGRPQTAAPLMAELAGADIRHHPTIVCALTELLDQDEALRGINASMRAAARPALVAQTASPDPWAAFRALDVLRKLDDRESLDAVFRALETDNELVQAGALRALEGMARPNDVPRLEAFLAGTTPAIGVELGDLLERLRKG